MEKLQMDVPDWGAGAEYKAGAPMSQKGRRRALKVIKAKPLAHDKKRKGHTWQGILHGEISFTDVELKLAQTILRPTKKAKRRQQQKLAAATAQPQDPPPPHQSEPSKPDTQRADSAVSRLVKGRQKEPRKSSAGATEKAKANKMLGAAPAEGPSKTADRPPKSKKHKTGPKPGEGPSDQQSNQAETVVSNAQQKSVSQVLKRGTVSLNPEAEQPQVAAPRANNKKRVRPSISSKAPEEQTLPPKSKSTSADGQVDTADTHKLSNVPAGVRKAARTADGYAQEVKEATKRAVGAGGKTPVRGAGGTGSGLDEQPLVAKSTATPNQLSKGGPRQTGPGAIQPRSVTPQASQPAKKPSRRDPPLSICTGSPRRVATSQQPDRTDTEVATPAQNGGGSLPSKGAAAAPGRSFNQRLQAQVSGSKFRFLNETLYTTKGSDAFELFQSQPELFDQYHVGFQAQTHTWPERPVDRALRFLARFPETAVVADFGCGDAELGDRAPHKVLSLDLVATKPGVIACNMADTPLGDASVDVAVFSLALMGTDYPGFLREAARVLKNGGWLWVAEVRSRFVEGGREEYGAFLAGLRGLGFQVKKQDKSNKMFVVMELQKVGKGKRAEAEWPELRACLYKRR